MKTAIMFTIVMIMIVGGSIGIGWQWRKIRCKGGLICSPIPYIPIKTRYSISDGMAVIESGCINLAESNDNLTISGNTFVEAESIELKFCDKCQGVIPTEEFNEKNTTWTGDTFFCLGHPNQ